MKKIAIFLWNNFVNDARVRREVSALSERGHNVTVICTYDGDEKELFEEENFKGAKVIRIHHLKSVVLKLESYKDQELGLVKSLRTKIALRALYTLNRYKISDIINVGIITLGMIRYGIKEKYDIYHANDLKTLPQGYICAKFNKKAKLIYDSHEVETSRAGGKGKLKYLVEKQLIYKVDHMIMTTQTRAKYVSEQYTIGVPTVIHNYPIYREKDITKNNLYELLDIEQTIPLFLYQGGLQVGRGLEKILDAVPLFKEGILVIIGDGPLKEKLKEKTEQNKIQNRVRFISKVPAEELLYYTQHAYLGFQVLENTCFNHYSALSNKLLEYIMMEVPVICSKLPEMEKIVNECNVGWCIESIEASQIAHQVNRLLEDKRTHNKFKQNCKKYKQLYTWDKEKDKFLKIYES